MVVVILKGGKHVDPLERKNGHPQIWACLKIEDPNWWASSCLPLKPTKRGPSNTDTPSIDSHLLVGGPGKLLKGFAKRRFGMDLPRSLCRKPPGPPFGTPEHRWPFGKIDGPGFPFEAQKGTLQRADFRNMLLGVDLTPVLRIWRLSLEVARMRAHGIPGLLLG